MVACFKRILAATALALALASCSKDNYTSDVPSDIYTFALSDDQTRSVLAQNEKGKYGHWESGDKLGTAVATVKPGYSYVNIGTPCTFSIYRQGGLTAGEMLYVYYPYNAGTASVNAVNFEIPTAQQQNGSTFDFDAMPMAAAPYTVQQTVQNDKYTKLGDIRLYNLAAVLELKLFSSNANYRSEIVSRVRFDAQSAIAGSFTKDITSIEEDSESSMSISGFSAKSVTTELSAAPALGASLDAAYSVYMVVAPGTTGGSITVVTDKAEYTYPLSSSQEFKRSVCKSFGIDLARGSRKASGGSEPDPDSRLLYLNCYEVPAISVSGNVSKGQNSGRDDIWYAWNTTNSMQRVVTHTFSYENRRRRNYTSYFDGTKHCPLFVAFPMQYDEWPDNNVGRNEAWDYDPAVDQSWQQNGLKNAGTVGLSRGHFAASDYRQVNVNQNKQTFYYTNQAPQWQNNFNGGVWGNLEQAVKSATPSGRDTLYVVVGVLFEGTVSTKPSKDGKDVSIPSHFYKCVMKCSFSASGAMTDAKGAAYLFTNEAHPKAVYSSFITTIDEIEQRSGLDLFPRVPDSLQEAAEKTATAFL